MSRCRNATSRRPERRAHPRHVVRAVPPPRPHARLPEAGVAPSRCPIPEAAPTPRRLGSHAVVWRAPRPTRRHGRGCSRSPAGARPAPRPAGSATWRASPIKRQTDPARMKLVAVSQVRHRMPWAPSPVNVATAPSYDSVASPTPRLEPIEAQPSPCCAVVPRTSPERAPPWRPPPGAAEGARRRYHRPNQGSKSSLGHPWTTPRPSPADPAAGARRYFTTRAGRRPEDHIARPQVFLRANPQSKGTFVRSRTFLGTPGQK
jgi:hypothetical protein